MFKRIVVPLDGSDLAELALPVAENLSQLTGADLHLVRVVNIYSPSHNWTYAGFDVFAYNELVESDDQETVRYLAKMLRKYQESGLNVTVEEPKGRAADEICRLVRPDDLIVMVTHGRSGLARTFIGSVADAIVRHSTVPVLLVRGSVAPVEHDSSEATKAELATAS